MTDGGIKKRPTIESLSLTTTPRGHFKTTQWDVIDLARRSSHNQQQESWNELIQSYWYPIYAFCRRRGYPNLDAQDLTQGFFTHLLESSALESVAPERGRFRSFLLASFQNYVANQLRNASTQRRGGGHLIQSLDGSELDARFSGHAGREETPEQAFERSWVESLLLRVRIRLEKDYQQAGREELFALLEPHLTMSKEGLPRAEIAGQLNLSTAAIAMSLHRMRRRFGELLVSEIALTVDSPDEVDEELRRLMAIVRGDSK